MSDIIDETHMTLFDITYLGVCDMVAAYQAIIMYDGKFYLSEAFGDTTEECYRHLESGNSHPELPGRVIYSDNSRSVTLSTTWKHYPVTIIFNLIC